MRYFAGYLFFGAVRAVNRDGRRKELELYASETTPGHYIADEGYNYYGGGPITYNVCWEKPGQMSGYDYNASVLIDDEYYYLFVADDDPTGLKGKNEELKTEIARLNRDLEEARRTIQSLRNSLSQPSAPRQVISEDEMVRVLFCWKEGSWPSFGHREEYKLMTKSEYLALLSSGPAGIEAAITRLFFHGNIVEPSIGLAP